jgi:AhpD family alkylhydroperoxidase
LSIATSKRTDSTKLAARETAPADEPGEVFSTLATMFKRRQRMEPRLDFRKFNAEPLQALQSMEQYLGGCGLEHKFLHLLKLRASQINGCAYCIDMHSIDARAAGETEQRLYALNAWRETPFFTDRERAALAWMEAITLLAESHVPDNVYEDTRKHFSDQEIVDLTYLAATINAWNRLAVSLRSVPGRYRAKSTA